MDLDGFTRDLNALCTAVQPFVFELSGVRITEEGLVIVLGNAFIEKSIFFLQNYPELDEPKRKSGYWHVTIGYLRTIQPFSSDEEQKQFESGFMPIKNSVIGQTTVRQVWLVHYANRTLSLIIGKSAFALGGTNSLDGGQLLEHLGIID